VARALAFLFDLDGTLVDSMPHHDAAWVEWHARRGMLMNVEGFFASTAGRSNPEILADLFPELGLAEHEAMAQEKEEIYRERASRSLGLIAGAQAFAAAARGAGLRLSICTAATPENMAIAFAVHGIDRWVDTVVSPADGLRGKPHPDIFLEAAKRLGVAPTNCIVFEDAPLGVEAARRAGMRAVALTTSLPAQAFSHYPNVIAIHADFESLSPLALFDLTKEQHHA
jgi:HAD superfamily hydrolase (TIGR01509 family)